MRFQRFIACVGIVAVGLLGLPADSRAGGATQSDNITGSGDDPSITTKTSDTLGYTQDDVLDFVQQMDDLANAENRNTVRYTGDTVINTDADGNYTVNGVLTDPPIGTVDAPKVTVVDGGNVSMRGAAAGNGIIIVKSGSLDMRGAAEFRGLVIVLDGASASVGQRGNPAIYGSTLALNTSDGQAALDIRGNTDLNYSTQGLELSRQALLNTMTWDLLAMYDVTLTGDEKSILESLLSP